MADRQHKSEKKNKSGGKAIGTNIQARAVIAETADAGHHLAYMKEGQSSQPRRSNMFID